MCPTEMEVSDSELRNKMLCAIQFCYRLGKIVPETLELRKEAHKDKCFSQSTIFRCHGDLKERKKDICLQNQLLNLVLRMQTRICKRYEWKLLLQNDSNFLKAVITDDETWVHHFYPLTKSTGSQEDARGLPLPPQKMSPLLFFQK